MPVAEVFGFPFTGGEPDAVAHYNTALTLLLMLRSDPVAAVDAATRIDPGLVMTMCSRVCCVFSARKWPCCPMPGRHCGPHAP
jgi:hypothetical protein